MFGPFKLYSKSKFGVLHDEFMIHSYNLTQAQQDVSMLKGLAPTL